LQVTAVIGIFIPFVGFILVDNYFTATFDPTRQHQAVQAFHVHLDFHRNVFFTFYSFGFVLVYCWL
jgi:hypothetical protein